MSDSALILPRRYHNAQIGEKERIVVYFHSETKRILGFGHESIKPLFRMGYTSKVLYHANEIDKYAELYRRQEQEDAEAKDFIKSERESPARAAIRAAMVARRAHVSADDRRYLDANIALMDQREARMKKRKQEMYLLCEKYEQGVTAEDLGMQSAMHSPEYQQLVKESLKDA